MINLNFWQALVCMTLIVGALCMNVDSLPSREPEEPMDEIDFVNEEDLAMEGNLASADSKHGWWYGHHNYGNHKFEGLKGGKYMAKPAWWWKWH